MLFILGASRLRRKPTRRRSPSPPGRGSAGHGERREEGAQGTRSAGRTSPGLRRQPRRLLRARGAAPRNPPPAAGRGGAALRAALRRETSPAGLRAEGDGGGGAARLRAAGRAAPGAAGPQNLSGEGWFKTLELDDPEVLSRKCLKTLKIMVSSPQEQAKALSHSFTNE
ncbi:uncharacterized protein LOC127387428 isoform X2 [Apus apus]|uniref:uncharacterized protein LOC127387428 isoform X2 n=2 Tax=Apus apus TaxID=8895 RepID=UPI0021F90674|nr:uncharacterized protein LOC127387428 isoform X2 [Apus apus]